MIEPIIALIALSLMEIILGIDNIVFISVATAKLPADQQSSGRRLGLLLALGTRILLLSCIFWIAQLVTPVITLSEWLPIESLQSFFVEREELPGHGLATFSNETAEEEHLGTDSQEPEFDQEAWDEFDEISWRDIILIFGGLFLIYSSVHEIHSEVEVEEQESASETTKGKADFLRVLVQIAVMDVIFSLDSVITAVGMANQLWVMITAVVLAVGVMIWFADQVGNFVDQNPTIKMLALAFLLLIGVMLVAEGIGTPISKGYIYFAMGFSLLVESFNLRVRSRRLSPMAETAGS